MQNEIRVSALRVFIFSLVASLVFLGGQNIIFPSEIHAAAPIADIEADQDGFKTSLLAGEVVLEGSVSSDNPNDTFDFEWYGPFGAATGSSSIFQMPQGTYTVSFQAVGCPESSDVATTEITISPAFTITPRSKTDKVQFTWTHIDGTDHYDVYRADENDPLSFEKIAETTSTYSTYLDYDVVNETNYLYAVSAIDENGDAAFSNIVAACPPESRATARLNRTPMIYSQPVAEGSVGIIYEYTVLAADANSDTLSFSLVDAPSDMSIDTGTGKIQWTPTAVETVDVTVNVSDPDGLEDSQIFSINITAPTPEVSLTADPDSVFPGQIGEESSNLSWCAVHAEYCVIEPDIGEVASSGSVEVSPDENTEYTIFAYGPGGEAYDAATVSAGVSQPVVSIFANPKSILLGEETQLLWRSTNAETVAIDQGIGSVALSSDDDPDGGRIVAPEANTVYTISAVGPGGTATDSVTVVVENTPPPNVDIVAVEEEIIKGENSWLYWASNNADSVSIDQGLGEVAANGCYGEEDDGGYPGLVFGECGEGIKITPETTTTYTITATGDGGTTADSVTVIVNEPAAPSVVIVSAAESIDVGDSTWLYWNSSNADTVTIDQGIGTVAANGCYGDLETDYWNGAVEECQDNYYSGEKVSPQTTTTYTITATGPGGTVTDSVTVSVNETLPAVEIIAEPETIESGDKSWLYWHSTDAEIVSISPDIGVVDANGCSKNDGDVVVFPLEDGGECGDGISVSPTATTTYMITAVRDGKIATDTVTVFVEEVPLPTVNITADPYLIDYGATSWLTWDATNVVSVSIDQGIGNVVCDIGYGGYGDCEDVIAVSPTVTTTYTITATGPGGTAIDTVTVYVDQVPPPIVSITADPEEIYIGDSSWLSWEATNVVNVSIDQGIGNVVCDIGYGYGGYGDCENLIIVTPEETTTYTITATGPGGTTTDTVTVYVDENPPPTVSLTANPVGVDAGDTSWLAWKANNATAVSVDNEIGVFACDDGVCDSGLAVSPAETTTYSITATGLGGTATDTATIYVDENPPPTVAIIADPETIEIGDTSWLTWEATNVASVSIDQGIGNVACDYGYGGFGDCEDMIAITPEETTTYTITATGPGGTATETVTVQVDENPPPTVSISATPETIDPGDIGWLIWEANNATSFSIDQGIGNVACDYDFAGDGECGGATIVSPTISTTYTITASGTGGTATDSVAVTVGDGSIPTADFYAEPEYIYNGGSTTLHWKTENTDSVSIDQGIGDVALNSDETGIEVSPETTTTYTMTVTGAGGQGTVSLTVLVIDPLAPLVELIVWPETIGYGGSSTLAWSSADADSVIIEASAGDDVGEVDLNSDGLGLSVSLKTTTTYTITATGAGGAATDSVTVNVLPEIRVDRCDQPLTAGESCLLEIETINGETVTMDQGIGDVVMTAGNDYSANGSVTVSPLEKTTYTITATGDGGTSTREVTVDVAPYLDFYTEQDLINAGDSAYLHWATLQADTVTLEPDFGEVAESTDTDGFSVSPVESTTYELEAVGPTHGKSQSIRIYVNDLSQPPVVTTFKASPSTIRPGNTAVLTWETANMDEARIDNGIGDVPMYGSVEVSPERTTTYTLVVEGPQGYTTEQTTVTVSGTWESGGFGDLYGDLTPEDGTQINDGLFSLLTGFCTDQDGNPVSGVGITILEQSDFGEAYTDDQGRYSMPVEGDHRYTVVMNKEGYLPVHRKAEVLKNRIAVMETVALTVPDAVSTLVDFSGDEEAVIFHGGGFLSDEDGQRRLVMTIPYSDAFEEPGEIAVTEYPDKIALPAELPSNASLVFAAEIGISRDDEDAGSIAFNKPAVAWVDNFLGFTAGQTVPVGWYDRDEGLWVPRENGVVVRLLDGDDDDEVDGVDIDGDDTADDLDGDGETADEVAGLSIEEMTVGGTYCRFEVDKTGPWALGWPYASMSAPSPSPEPAYNDLETCESGECDLKEQDIAIPGTDFFLHYSESRTSAYEPVITIPVTGESVPADVESVKVRMTVAGRVFEDVLSPDPDQTVRYQWDGLDFLGQEVVGETYAEIAIGYVYDRNYAFPGAFTHDFSQFGEGDTGIEGREKYIAWHLDRIRIDRFSGSVDFIADGWTLSAQHLTPDDEMESFYFGDGTKLSWGGMMMLEDIFDTSGYIIPFYGGGFVYHGLALDDASRYLYLTDIVHDVIWRIDGNYSYDVEESRTLPYKYAGDYTGWHKNKVLDNPTGIAIDGTGIYYAEMGGNVIRKGVDKDHYAVFAGNGQEGYSGDGQDASDAEFSELDLITLDDWGNLYVIDQDNHVIRRISADGIIQTIAGNGIDGSDGDNGPALSASISPAGIAVDDQGNIYIAEPDYYRVRKIDVSGMITAVAGTGIRGYSDFGGEAVSTQLNGPESVAVDSLGNLFIGDYYMLKLDSAGVLTQTEFVNNSWKLNASEMVIDINDRIFVDHSSVAIYRVSEPSFIKMDDSDLYRYIGPDGENYYFSDKGKHLYTGSADSPTYSFVYDIFNYDRLLVAVLDADGNTILSIVRDTDGKVLSLESGDGTTSITIDDDNLLVGLTTPDETSATMSYDDDGVLADIASSFSTGSIQGIVTDKETGLPLEGITVDLIGTSGTATLLTEADGSYSFSDLGPESYTLEFTHSDYVGQSVECELIFGANQLTRNITLQMSYPQPEIVSFTVDPEVVDPGCDTTVSWETKNATYVLLSDYYLSFYNEKLDPNGSSQRTLERSTYYILQAFNPTGESEKYYIQVLKSSVWGKIDVEPDVITADESATLSWSSSGSGALTINGVEQDYSGEIVVSPEETTTYYLNIDTGQTYRSYSTTVTVIPTLSLEMTSPSDGEILTSPTVQVSGQISFDATVIVNGVTAVVDGGQFSAEIELPEEGLNTITATAEDDYGHEAVSEISVYYYPVPEITLSVSPETVWTGESAELSWTSEDATACSIDNGIGEVGLSGSMDVTPETTTTYTITATGENGDSTASATVTVLSPISLEITSPSNGEVIERPDVMVEGTFSNAYGNVTGITVNGEAALISGNRFVANHVALQEGENTLTVTATDMEGNTVTESVDVTAETTGDYIRIRAIPESGVSPLESTLEVDGSFTIESTSLSSLVDGSVEFLEAGPDEFVVGLTGAGLYYFTAEVETDDSVYTDTVAIVLAEQDELDDQLQAVFAGLKTALAAGDIDGAVSMFTARSRDKYEEAFEERTDSLGQIASDMGGIELIYVYEDMAKYRIHRTEDIDGDQVDITYYLYFRVDSDGVWRLEQF